MGLLSWLFKRYVSSREGQVDILDYLQKLERRIMQLNARVMTLERERYEIQEDSSLEQSLKQFGINASADEVKRLMSGDFSAILSIIQKNPQLLKLFSGKSEDLYKLTDDKKLGD